MVTNGISRTYAGALVESGLEKNILPQIEEEFPFVLKLFSEDRSLYDFLTAPVAPREVKKNFIKKVFQKELSEVFVGFLNVLIDNDRQTLLDEIYHSFQQQVDEARKRQRIKLTSSTKLDDGTLNDIRSMLSKKLGKDVIIEELIDSSIIGGIVIEINDSIIDGSIASRLKSIKDTLLKSKVAIGVAYED